MADLPIRLGERVTYIYTHETLSVLNADSYRTLFILCADLLKMLKKSIELDALIEFLDD